MRFRSEIGWWVFAVIPAVAAFILIILVPPIRTGEVSIAYLLLILLIALGLPIWLVLNTAYNVDADSLKIRSGPFTWNVSLQDIHSVKSSRALWSAPALSFNRLKIQYGDGKWILVSPKDRKGFLEAIGHSESRR